MGVRRHCETVNIFKGQIVICPYRRDSHHVHFKYNIFPVSCVGANDYSPFFFGDLSTRNDGALDMFLQKNTKRGPGIRRGKLLQYDPTTNYFIT